jgi:hypothetical protein
VATFSALAQDMSFTNPTNPNGINSPIYTVPFTSVDSPRKPQATTTNGEQSKSAEQRSQSVTTSNAQTPAKYIMILLFSILATASTIALGVGIGRLNGIYDPMLGGWVDLPDHSTKTNLIIGGGCIGLILFFVCMLKIC